MLTMNKALIAFSVFSLLIVAVSLSENFTPTIERTLSTRLQEVEIGELKKLSDLVEGEWDKACLMDYYQSQLRDNVDEEIRSINKRLEDERLCLNDGCWNLVLKNTERFSR